MTCLKKGFEDGFGIAASAIHGRGLRSTRTRRRGEELFVVHGKPMNMPFDDEYAYAPNWIGIGWESWLLPERGNPIRYTNHSCDPNAIVSEGLVVIAIEDIPSGGEVLVDYATTEVDPRWQLRCRCGSPRCRGQIRSYPLLSRQLKERYAPHLPVAFLEGAQRVASQLQFDSEALTQVPFQEVSVRSKRSKLESMNRLGIGRK